MRYLISVGRDKLRAKTLIDLWDICDREESTMADEVWDALYTHVERYGKTHDGGDGRGLMDRGPQPDFSMPEENEHFEKQVDEMVAEELEEKVYENIFDDIVKDESVLAAAEEVEEVLDEERTESRIVDSRNMYGRKGGKR